MGVHREVMKVLQLPGYAGRGLRGLVDAVIERKRREINEHDVPDVDLAFRRWTDTIRRNDYPENAFGRVMAAVLRSENDPDGSSIGDAAMRWLQGDMQTLIRDEMRELRLAPVPARDQASFGRNLLFSSIRFLPQAGVHGLVLLMDEVETLFTARGSALRRLLAALRVLLDAPVGAHGGLPLFCVFSATPDILDHVPTYPALAQRLAVLGAPFHEGNDLAIQLSLDRIESQETLLASIGAKLVAVGALATGHAFDVGLQTANATRLAEIAASRNLEVDARRLYVKTWVNLLEVQRVQGERAWDTEELSRRYQGAFDAVHRSDSGGVEP